MREDAIHPSPLNMQPSVIRKRAPKRSISQPWNGERKVCNTISNENVIWIAGSAPPVAVWNGLTNRVHTYCGLEIAIIATRPRPNWAQREGRAAGRGMVSVWDIG